MVRTTIIGEDFINSDDDDDGNDDDDGGDDDDDDFGSNDYDDDNVMSLLHAWQNAYSNFCVTPPQCLQISLQR